MSTGRRYGSPTVSVDELNVKNPADAIIFTRSNYYFFNPFSPFSFFTVYQLQQEAPHPRRLTCTCEVRTWVLPFCLWLQSSSIDWRLHKLHPQWVVFLFKVVMDFLGVIFVRESNLVYLRMFWATPHSHHGRAPFHQSHSKQCCTFLFHFMNHSRLVYIYISVNFMSSFYFCPASYWFSSSLRGPRAESVVSPSTS